jgi:hypothetical protein
MGAKDEVMLSIMVMAVRIGCSRKPLQHGD